MFAKLYGYFLGSLVSLGILKFLFGITFYDIRDAFFGLLGQFGIVLLSLLGGILVLFAFFGIIIAIMEAYSWIERKVKNA